MHILKRNNVQCIFTTDGTGYHKADAVLNTTLKYMIAGSATDCLRCTVAV